jgi:hypothetical protein
MAVLEAWEINMAQQNIVGGLFGITPEMYQQRQANDARAQAVQYAGMTPQQQAQFSFYSAGQNIPKAIGGMLGVEDPQLAMIRDVQSMRGQFDVSTPDGLRSFAQALGQKGYTDLAIQASAEADKRALTQAQTTRALREPAMNAFEKLVSSGKYTPESLAKYQNSGNVGDLRLVKGAAGEGEGVGVAGPVGKSGAWRDADGIVYSAAEMKKQREGFQGAEKLLENLNSIKDTDVKDSESWIDWTQGDARKQIGGKVAQKTISAQAKINASQLLKQIESLPPGSASNADMIAAKSSFPGYGNADNLQRWINDTKALLQNSLSRQSEQYGFKQRVTAAPTQPNTLAQPSAGTSKTITLKNGVKVTVE